MRPPKSHVYSDGGKKRGVMGVAELCSRRPQRERARNGRKLNPLIPKPCNSLLEKERKALDFSAQRQIFSGKKRE